MCSFQSIDIYLFNPRLKFKFNITISIFFHTFILTLPDLYNTLNNVIELTFKVLNKVNEYLNVFNIKITSLFREIIDQKRIWKK